MRPDSEAGGDFEGSDADTDDETDPGAGEQGGAGGTATTHVASWKPNSNLRNLLSDAEDDAARILDLTRLGARVRTSALKRGLRQGTGSRGRYACTGLASSPSLARRGLNPEFSRRERSSRNRNDKMRAGQNSAATGGRCMRRGGNSGRAGWRGDAIAVAGGDSTACTLATETGRRRTDESSHACADHPGFFMRWVPQGCAFEAQLIQAENRGGLGRDSREEVMHLRLPKCGDKPAGSVDGQNQVCFVRGSWYSTHTVLNGITEEEEEEVEDLCCSGPIQVPWWTIRRSSMHWGKDL
ncbi:hypothetical protein FB451DRAFT_1171975 [Mycena latifolia]|nr:hypothetical protein FB451DRAFT_1171975 [Mycena latifolia]